MTNGIDLSKVSAAVKQETKTIAAGGGNKKRIDTPEEFARLQELGKKLETTGSKAEREYVTGLAVEYQERVDAEAAEAAEKRQKAEVTPAARDAVKELKSFMSDKKELDEPEARMLLELIKNTRGDYNAADIEYFKQELMKAGFGALLNELEAQADSSKATKSAEPAQTAEQSAQTPDSKTEPKTDATSEPTEKPIEKPITADVPVGGEAKPVKKPSVGGKGKSGRSQLPGGKFNPDAPTPAKTVPSAPAPKTSPKISKKPNSTITPAAERHGEIIANDLAKAVKFGRNGEVHKLINSVNKNNAYSFLISYAYGDGDNKLDVNRDIYGLSDVFDRITADDAKHLVNVTLQQAKSLGLENNKAYQNLNQIYTSMNTTLHGTSDPDPALQKRLDSALISMANAMTQVVK